VKIFNDELPIIKKGYNFKINTIMKPLYIIVILALSLSSIVKLTNGQVIPTTIGYINGKPVMKRNGANVLFKGIQYWGLESFNTGNWDSDIQEFDSLGLNGVRLNITWNKIETGDDSFDFSHLDSLLDKLDDANLMVYLQFNCSAIDWVPDWFTSKYSDNQLYAYDDVGGKQYSRLSFGSPYFKSEYQDYVETTINHVKNRECIVAYSVYTEPHFANIEQWMDYNPYNISAFRDWLDDRYYNSIDSLNNAWNSSYNNFSEVNPDDRPPSGWTSLSNLKKKRFADWEIWNCIVKADFIGGIIKHAKENVDPNHLYGQNMMWKWANGYIANVLLEPEINYGYADIIGINTYPISDRYTKIGDQVNFIMNLHNCQKIVWLSEFNNKNGNASETDLHLFTQEAFDEGCTGFVYFTYNGNFKADKDKYGVVYNGSRKDSWYSLQNFMENYITGNESTILGTSMPEPRVNFLWTKINRFETYLDDEYSLAQFNTFRTWLYHNNNICVGVISEKSFINGDFDINIPIVIPSTPFVNTQTRAKLKTYVQDTGITVLVTGRYGQYYYSDSSACIKNSTWPRYEDNIDINFKVLTKGPVFDKIDVQTNFYELTTNDQNIQPEHEKLTITPNDDAIIIAKWESGDTALVAQPVGNGYVMYYGTHLFVADNTSNSDFNGRLLKSFVEWAEDCKSATIGTAIDDLPTDNKGNMGLLYEVKNNTIIIKSAKKLRYSYSIFTSDGKKISRISQGNNTIDISQFKGYVYFLCINDSNGESMTIKFLGRAKL